MQAYTRRSRRSPPTTNGYTLPANAGASLVIKEGNIFSGKGNARRQLPPQRPGGRTYTVTIQGTADSTLTTGI